MNDWITKVQCNVMLEEVYAQSSLANQPPSLIRTQTPPTCLKESPHVWFVDRHRGEHVRRAIIRLDSGRTNYKFLHLPARSDLQLHARASDEQP